MRRHQALLAAGRMPPDQPRHLRQPQPITGWHLQWIGRHAMGLQPLRRGAGPALQGADALRHPVAVRQLAEAQGHVDARLQQVGPAIVEVQVHAQLRVVVQPLAQRRADLVGHAQRRGHPQFADRLLPGRRQFRLGLAGRIQQARAGRVVAAADIGQRQPPRGAVQQRHPGFTLKHAQLLADRRGTHPQRARRRTQRTVLHHPGEQGHAFQTVHRPPPCHPL
jgi:hypothetical protein